MSMKRSVKISVAIGCLVFMGSSELIASPVTVNTVDDAVQYGLIHNPLLKSQKYKLNASRELPVKLGSLVDPKIGLRLNGSPAKNSSYDVDQKRYFIGQSFPFLGELGRKQKLGEMKSSLEELNYTMSENNLIFQIEKTYYNLVLTKSLIRITEKNRDVLKKMVNIADVKYQSGSGIQGNVLKAEVTKDKLDEQLFNLQLREVQLNATFSQLLGLSPSENMAVSLNYTAAIEVIISTPNQAWVDTTLHVRRADIAKDLSNQKKRVEEDRYLPNFSAQVEYWDNSGMNNQYGGQIGMTFPWLNGKNAAATKEAKWMALSSIELRKNSENISASQLKSLVSEINTMVKTIQLYENSLLKNAELSLNSFQKAYEVDQVSFIDYFEAEKMLFGIEMDYEKLLNRYHTLRAILNSYYEKGGLPYGR